MKAYLYFLNILFAMFASKLFTCDNLFQSVKCTFYFVLFFNGHVVLLGSLQQNKQESINISIKNRLEMSI